MDSVRLSFSIGTSIKVFLYYREWRYANYLLVKTELCKLDKNLNSGQQLHRLETRDEGEWQILDRMQHVMHGYEIYTV